MKTKQEEEIEEEFNDLFFVATAGRNDKRREKIRNLLKERTNLILDIGDKGKRKHILDADDFGYNQGITDYQNKIKQL